jgi:hypothetical protein
MPHIGRLMQLAEAVTEVTASTESTEKQAKIDICRAIADESIDIEAKLRWHTTKGLVSKGTVDGRSLEIPKNLKPDDLDWENSRPRKSWAVRRGSHPAPGHWELASIEVSREDIAAVLCEERERPITVAAVQAPSKKSSPLLGRARRQIKQEYPNGVPDQAELSNAASCARITI